MKIAIFGASGHTGGLLTERSLAAGHSVAALVRTPAKFAYADKVRVVEGDASSASAISETVRGADAVFSALGAKSPLHEDDVLERGVPLIVAAMKDAGVARIIALVRRVRWIPRWISSPRGVAFSLKTSCTRRS